MLDHYEAEIRAEFIIFRSRLLMMIFWGFLIKFDNGKNFILKKDQEETLLNKTRFENC